MLATYPAAHQWWVRPQDLPAAHAGGHHGLMQSSPGAAATAGNR